MRRHGCNMRKCQSLACFGNGKASLRQNRIGKRLVFGFFANIKRTVTGSCHKLLRKVCAAVSASAATAEKRNMDAEDDNAQAGSADYMRFLLG